MGRAVEGGVLGVVYVGVDGAAAVEEEIVLDAVGGGAEAEAFGADSFRQVAPEIAAGAHFCGGPVGEAAVVHGEAVVMFENGDDVLGAGFLEEAGPGGGVEILGFEHGDEIFVAEF